MHLLTVLVVSVSGYVIYIHISFCILRTADFAIVSCIMNITTQPRPPYSTHQANY